MPESVRGDGAVCGPAPQGKSSVTQLADYSGRSVNAGIGKDNTVQTPANNTHGTTNIHCNTVASLPSVLASLKVAKNDFHSATLSQREYESRLERISSTLLINGECIPALDQGKLSMLQEVYINAAIAAQVAAETTLIANSRVEYLQDRLNDLGTDEDVILPKAA